MNDILWIMDHLGFGSVVVGLLDAWEVVFWGGGGFCGFCGFCGFFGFYVFLVSFTELIPSLKFFVNSSTSTLLLSINFIISFSIFCLCYEGATLFQTLSSSFPFISEYLFSFNFWTTKAYSPSILKEFLRT